MFLNSWQQIHFDDWAIDSFKTALAAVSAIVVMGSDAGFSR
jgi:hypothetical protein